VGKAIGLSDIVTGSQSYDFTKIKQLLDGAEMATKFVPGCQSGGAPAIKGQFSVKTAKECCESTSSIIDSTGFEGSVSVEIPAITCRVPAFSWGVATLTGNFGLGGVGTLAASGYQSDCEENCDWTIEGSVGVNVSGALGVNVLHPDVLEVQAGIKGGGKISVKDECGAFSASGCIGPPSAFGSVTLGGWIGKEISYTFKDAVACYP